MKHFVTRLSAVLVISALLLNGCAQQEAKKPSLPTPPQKVKVLNLSEKPSYLIQEVATLKPAKEVELIAKAGGNIDQLSIKLGDKVQEGQIIALINQDKENDPADVNYQTAKLQLSNAKQTLDESVANNQDMVERAQLRTKSLQDAISRLTRNREELLEQNQNSETSLKLQVENAQKNLEVAESNYTSLIDKLAQSEKNLISNIKNSLDSILIDMDAGFKAAENILNPSKAQHFNVSLLNKSIGAANSILRSDTISSYLTYREAFSAVKKNYEASLPITETNAEQTLSEIKGKLNELRLFLDELRTLLTYSVTGSGLTQATLEGFKAEIAAAEATILGDLAKVDTLLQNLANFRLDRTSQTTNAESSKIIAQNQLTEANNSLLKFNVTRQATVKDLEAQIQQTNNDLLAAQTDLDSTQRNNVIQNSSKRLEINTLTNQLRLAENALNNNEVTSTISGVVSSLNVEDGDYVNPGMPLGKVIQSDELKAVFYLPKEQANRLSIGQKFEFKTSDGQEPFKGFISKMSPSADPLNKKIGIEGAIENRNALLKAEMLVNVELNLSDDTFDENKIYVPMNAIIFGQNTNFVYTVENNVAMKKEIQIGEVFGMWIEVVSGLTKKDRVITEGQRNLPPQGGIPVTVAP